MLDTILKSAARLACIASLAIGPVMAAEPGARQIEIADYRGYLADDHPVRQGMRRFAELVDVGSGGSLHVKVRSDALPGTPAQQIAALRAGEGGAPALMLVAATGLATVRPEFELLDLPFLVSGPAQADALLDGAFGRALLERLATGGLAGLAWWENGFRQMTSSGAPIRGAADLRGLTFRVIGEPVFVDTFRALGSKPVPLPFGELRAALQSKRVAAEDNFYSQILAARLYEVQSSLSVSNHSYSPLVLVANARAWAGLTPAQQGLLRAAAVEAGRFQRAAVREEAGQARARLAAQGMAIHELTAFELEKLKILTQPVRDRYFGKYSGQDTQDLRRLYEAGLGRAGDPAP